MSDTIKNGVTRHKLTPEENKKGAANSIRKKREKKTISEILKKECFGHGCVFLMRLQNRKQQSR